MRILYLVPDMYGTPGGIARHSQSVRRALHGNGIEVSVIVLHDQHGSDQGVDSGAGYHPCDGSRARFVAKTLLGLLERPSLVIVGHVHLLPPVLFPARVLGIPVAVFLYGVDAWERLPAIRRWALRHADGVIAISEYTARRACAANSIDPDKVRVVPCSLGSEFPGASVHEPIEGAAVHLLSVGRLSHGEAYKGHRQVIAAIPSLRVRYPDLVYDIVGDGDDRPSLQALARQHGLDGTVRFHGQVPDGELDRLYRRATLFVLPSSREGFGLVFLEAMAYGLPIVAGNRDATPEVVADRETGLLVDPGDPAALSSAIMTLLEDKSLRERFGRAGRRRVQERFSFPAFRERLVQRLAELRPELLECLGST